jgi:hypothetical protein
MACLRNNVESVSSSSNCEISLIGSLHLRSTNSPSAILNASLALSDRKVKGRKLGQNLPDKQFQNSLLLVLHAQDLTQKVCLLPGIDPGLELLYPTVVWF